MPDIISPTVTASVLAAVGVTTDNPVVQQISAWGLVTFIIYWLLNRFAAKQDEQTAAIKDLAKVVNELAVHVQDLKK